METNGVFLAKVSLAKMVLCRNDPEPHAAVSVTLACDFGNVRVPS